MLTCIARCHLGWLSCCLALLLSSAVGCGEKKAKPKSDKAVAKAEQAKLEQAKAKAAAEEKAKADAAKKKAEQLPPIGSKSMIATAPKDRKRSEGFSTSVQGREGFGSSTFQGGLGTTASSGMPGAAMGLGSDSAFDRVEAEIRAAAGDRKTLVVYICDQAASQMVNRLADRASRMLKGTGAPSTVQQNLSAAVVSFGDEVKVLTPEPVSDGAALAKAMNEVKGTSPAGKLAYKAVATAADTFGKFRGQDYEVLFVMLADEAAPDEEALKTAVAKLKRDYIPVYAFGSPEAFYAKNQTIAPGKPAGASWGVEHITVYTPARLNDADYVDSGYGNFGLERITRLTEGKFFRTRGRTSTGWATDPNGDIKSELVRKYAPEYISEAEYKAKADENKARKALLEASKLVIDAQFEPPVMTFLAGDDENQARFATAITAAQRKAAAPQQEFEKILTVLQAGEADRGKLGNPRWEAAYDLALGRAYAALARTLGYNKMLAQVKQGKAFTKPTSNTWELVPSPNFAGDSQLNTMAKKSREYLTRVVEQHPGTPWADIASKELMSECGWDWQER